MTGLSNVFFLLRLAMIRQCDEKLPKTIAEIPVIQVKDDTDNRIWINGINARKGNLFFLY